MKPLAVIICAVLAAVAALVAPQAHAVAASQTISVNGTSPGHVFDGVGALSAGASSRLLADYPPAQRTAILDYLFKPGYGASLPILKVEIGGDTNSTDGTELSHETQQGQVSCDTGYEWWLMEQAKRLNPGIKLYGLEWGAPGWTGDGTGTLWTTQNIGYLLDWLGCARQHGLTISYLGGWNEAATFPPSWFVQLRQALDAHGYSGVQIVATDGYNWTTIAADMASDPAFANAVSIIGEHYPCSATSCATPSSVLATGKTIWASEQGSAGYDSGASALASDINEAYVDGQMTATINWSLIWSAYSDLPYSGDGLMLANTPWSGHYQVGLSIWVMAHTAQFTSPGWRYLDSASVPLSGGGSVATLRSPASGNWSSIAETVGASEPQQVTYQVSGGLSAGPVQVWATNLNSSDSADWFRHVEQVRPSNGSFTLTLQPGYLYTVTTTTGQHKGSAPVPAAAAMRLPYSDNFNSYRAGSLARYVSDLGGAFQVEPCASAGGAAGGGAAGDAAAGDAAGSRLAGGMCLQQMVTQQPVQWDSTDNYPVTVVADPSWANYRASVSAMLEQPGYVELDARATAPGNGLAGYHFRVSNTGQWSVYAQASGASFGSAGPQTTLASGTASFGTDTWHRLGLAVRGDEITASLDGRTLATVLDNAYPVGQVGLETSPWVTAQFDNLRVTPESVPAKAQGPSIAAVSPSPVQIAAPGDSATVTTSMTNPGSLPARAVSASLTVPAGWTATALGSVAGSLAPGQSAPLSWQVTAPASATPGVYQATAAVTYAEGGLDWIDQVPVTVYLSIVPQSQMTATASSYQSGYPPGNAIDGNPSTLWHTEWDPDRVNPPQSITLDLGGSDNVSGLLYLPRQDGNDNGIITSYQVLVSQDGTTFTQVASGSWAEDETLKQVTFPATQARYVELVGVQGGNDYVSAAEINVIGSPAS
ncbi:MAG TPA: discoidin domain-containing protein [Trebonia sp.]|jgi:O-glycosyl hydrolase|nr:discoidin domain-containing protein [Trebonia sp.]